MLLQQESRHSSAVDKGSDFIQGISHRPRRVQFIVDTRTGEFFEANDFLANEKDPIRHEELFQLRLENKKRLRKGDFIFVCPLCPSGPQPLLLSGRSNRHFFFKHRGGSEECDVKLSRLTLEEIRRIKYNGQQRGPLHEKLKEEIARYLRLEDGLEGEVLVEKRVMDHSVSKDWRQPDLRAMVNGTSFAFEIQVSTDFLDVVIGRTVFYAERGIRLVWVFPKFSGQLEAHRFSESDIFYKNNSNAFVYDLEAAEQSKQEGRLFLKCRYRQYMVVDGKLVADWGLELVTLDVLRSSEDGEATFFHDTSRNKAWCESVILAELRLLEELAEKWRLADEESKRRKIEELMKFDPNNPADVALQFVRDLYRGNWEHWKGQRDPVTALTEPEHIERLNTKLTFDGDHADVVGNALSDDEKAGFIRYVFRSTQIRIAVNQLTVQGIPVLYWCMELENETSFRITAEKLFKKGYRLSSDDRKYLTSFYAKASDACDSGFLFRWSFVKFLSGIGQARLDDLPQIEHELFAILSLKMNKVIGSRFKNLKEVVNNMFQHHSGHGAIFLHAMDKYNQIDKLTSEDAKGTIDKKISAFVASKPKQVTQFDGIFSALFPELGTRQSWG